MGAQLTMLSWILLEKLGNVIERNVKTLNQSNERIISHMTFSFTFILSLQDFVCVPLFGGRSDAVSS